MTDTCSICGGTNFKFWDWFLSSNELSDGTAVCTDCVKKVSVLAWENLDKSDWTIEDVKQRMQVMETMKQRRENEFVKTAAVYRRDDPQKLMLAVDEVHGWWYTPEHGELFFLDQIDSWTLTVSVDVSESSGIHLKYKAPDPTMPVPGLLEEMDGLSLVIYLKDHPYAKRIEIPIVGAKPFLMMYKKYMNESYGCAKECYDLLDKYAKNASGEII